MDKTRTVVADVCVGETTTEDNDMSVNRIQTTKERKQRKGRKTKRHRKGEGESQNENRLLLRRNENNVKEVWLARGRKK